VLLHRDYFMDQPRVPQQLSLPLVEPGAAGVVGGY